MIRPIDAGPGRRRPHSDSLNSVNRYRPGVALIVVDMQNDFTDPNGSLFVRGGEGIVSTINGQVEAARSNAALVVYTQDWHPRSTPHFQKDGGPWPVHCVAETWGSELFPKLRVDLDAAIVRKGANGEDGYSGFTMRDPVTGETIPTPLEPLLREAGVTDTVICGIATDYCVRGTALDAARLGFTTTLLGDAIAAVDVQAGDGEKAIDEMRAAGVTLASTRER